MTKDQRLLADFMADLSEEAYYAGWMDGLEYALWEAVLGDRTQTCAYTYPYTHTHAFDLTFAL